jgi:delta 1-pyrroline-5-carboxylate dehydrogenase
VVLPGLLLLFYYRHRCLLQDILILDRQPFGGFKLSGIGTKAAGRDYLLQFLEPHSISENTQRQGFAPNPNAVRAGLSKNSGRGNTPKIKTRPTTASHPQQIHRNP